MDTWINACSNLLLGSIFNEAQINIKQDQYQYQAQINRYSEWLKKPLTLLTCSKIVDPVFPKKDPCIFLL